MKVLYSFIRHKWALSFRTVELHVAMLNRIYIILYNLIYIIIKVDNKYFASKF